jgi:hypothetical protein
MLMEAVLNAIANDVCEESESDSNPDREDESYQGSIFPSMMCTTGGLHSERDAWYSYILHTVLHATNCTSCVRNPVESIQPTHSTGFCCCVLECRRLNLYQCLLGRCIAFHSQICLIYKFLQFVRQWKPHDHPPRWYHRTSRYRIGVVGCAACVILQRSTPYSVSITTLQKSFKFCLLRPCTNRYMFTLPQFGSHPLYSSHRQNSRNIL